MSGLSGFSASFAITASALTAEKLRMDVISNNIANADTTRTIQGGPYIRQRVVFAPRVDTTNGFGPMFASSMGAMNSSSPMFDSMTSQEAQDMPMGVRVTGIIKDPSPPRMVYDPGHPDANSEGYVAYPNVNAVNEMVDLISASRAYEANITAFNATKSMALQALTIGK